MVWKIGGNGLALSWEVEENFAFEIFVRHVQAVFLLNQIAQKLKEERDAIQTPTS